MAKKQSLAKLRENIRRFKATVALGRDQKLTSVSYRYSFKANDEDDATDIAESDFNAKPGDESGHPQTGVYFVEATNQETGEIIFEDEGVYQPPREIGAETEEKEEKNPLVAGVKTLVAAVQQHVDNVSRDSRIIRDRVAEAETRLKEVEGDKHALVDAMNILKSENMQLTIQRDEAVQQQARAEEREQARIAELEAYHARGGELLPFAGEAGHHIVDRTLEVLGLHNPAASRETFEQCKDKIVDDLITQHLSTLITMVHEGKLDWYAVRYVIFSYTDVDPGDDPVSPDWDPFAGTPETPPEEPPPAEEVH